MKRFALALLGVALAACGEQTLASAASRAMDAARQSAGTEPQVSGPEGLTPAAAQTFQRLKAAADARDAASLIAVAAENPDFAFDIGPETSPETSQEIGQELSPDWDFAASITAAEMRGDDPTGALAQILALPHGETTLGGVRVFHWPFVDGGAPTRAPAQGGADAARSVGDEATAQLNEDMAAVGPRTGVDETGRWLFYLTGD